MFLGYKASLWYHHMFQVTGLKSTYGVLAITEAASGQTENTSCKLKGAEVRESKRVLLRVSQVFPEILYQMQNFILDHVTIARIILKH